MNRPLLDIMDLTKIYGGGFFQRGDQVVALQHFDLTIPTSPAGVVTIAGESGSGKTTLANLVLGFLKPTSGLILYKGRDVTRMEKAEKLEYRREVQAVFQDPYSVYNPFYRVKHIFDVVIKNFRLTANKEEARDLVEDALSVVGIKGEDVLHKYPHQKTLLLVQCLLVNLVHLLKSQLSPLNQFHGVFV